MTGYEAGTDVGTILFSQYADGELVQRGRCKALGGLHKNPKELIKRQQVIEVKHNGIMKRSGKLRHPQFLRLRDDKPREECEWSE